MRIHQVSFNFFKGLLMFFFPLEFFLLLEFNQWRKDFSSATQVRYEPPQEITLAKQRLQLLLVTWRSCVKNGLGLVLIDLNALLVDHKAKKITCDNAKCTFKRIHFQTMFPHSFKGMSKVV